MLPRIFIDRPIFAWVIAIGIMMFGVGAILRLGIEQYPDIAPTTINIRANYPGAAAQTVETSVTQVIEQQLTGVEGMLYFTSSSSSAGSANISVTLEKGVDPDIAQVQVQNRVQQALPRLPEQVQQQGLRVSKSNPDFLMVAAIYDATDKATNVDIGDYIVATLQDQIARLEGVGDVNVFGSGYAMRIWLDPARLAGVGLIPADVTSAIQQQNSQVAAGQIGGAPNGPEQVYTATVTAKSRLTTVEQFRNILLKTRGDGSQVRLSDVARVELGAQSYGVISRLNGHPGVGIAVSLAPGSDALKTAQGVKDAIAAASKDFPAGYKYAFPYDVSGFVKLSIEEVVKTLIEAIVLVVIVMFLFLQSWRATLIPAIAVPVVLLGTFGVLLLFGYTINTLTLFAMVLAIGLLVDDAIVVVENVERVMHEEPDLTPREATIKSMDEINTALVAIGLVLSAVFLPMAFFGGSTGVIYRQFAITIVAAMALSVFVALTLSPALAATLLKHRPDRDERSGLLGRAHDYGDRFNAWFDRVTERQRNGAARVINRGPLAMLVYGGILAGVAGLFYIMPTSFLPVEDQGRAGLSYQLPAGATIARTYPVALKIEDYFLNKEANTETVLTVIGSGQGGSGQNVGRGFVAFRDWSERKGRDDSVTAISRRATNALAGVPDARIYVQDPPAIRGLGQTDGFSMQLLNSGNLSAEAFAQRKQQLLDLARKEPGLAQIRESGLPDQPTLKVDVDPERVGALGIAQNQVDSTLAIAWGGSYVNDFIDRGRVKQVHVQGDAPHRSRPEDLDQWYVRTATGTMAPFSSFARTSWSQAPTSVDHFNGVQAYQIDGQAAPGGSSGAAMKTMERLAAQLPGITVAWSGLSFQERQASGQAPLLYGLSAIVIFLCLAALYESWSIPFSVMLVIPLGILGAALAVALRGMPNDVYFQVGLLTTMGLSAKNAILIVEFAELAEKGGKTPVEAALEAVRLRMRPIVMTSMAFIAGVLPLVFASGAGAKSRAAIGTAVAGGTLAATVLAVFFVPLFFVVVRKLFHERLKGAATNA